MVDIQYFTSTLPHITSVENIKAQIEQYNSNFTIDDAIRAWCEHDALHYLSGHPFTREGEEFVAYLEEVFHKGWLPLGSRYNANYKHPCKYDTITPELIDETAQMIRELIY